MNKTQDSLTKATHNAWFMEEELRESLKGCEDHMLFILLEQLLADAVEINQRITRIYNSLKS